MQHMHHDDDDHDGDGVAVDKVNNTITNKPYVNLAGVFPCLMYDFGRSCLHLSDPYGHQQYLAVLLWPVFINALPLIVWSCTRGSNIEKEGACCAVYMSLREIVVRVGVWQLNT
ncbi:hypothetical protein Trydic_g14521 [Trypoxylus dichotomus]